MACLFIEIYWSVGKTMQNLYWGVLNCNFEFPIIIISPICFHRVENCNKDSSTKTHFKRWKTSRLFRPSSILFCHNIWTLSRHTVPLKSIVALSSGLRSGPIPSSSANTEPERRRRPVLLRTIIGRILSRVLFKKYLKGIRRVLRNLILKRSVYNIPN